MQTESPKVYLDHLIPRENLRYKRSQERMPYEKVPEPPMLRMSDLVGNHISSRVKSLRKPDFQRATWAWTPDDCVSLLESIVNDQVIPSLIMWSSPENGFEYVLDGGHRISVVLAWLNDDWGDLLPIDRFKDEEEDRVIKQAAKEVRDLVKIKIGSISDYQAADEEFERAVMAGEAPKAVLSPLVFNRGLFYQKLRRGSVGFHILWVTGDYEKAELSFLKINKSGRQLSEWETKLIENRHSSLARAVMSISNITSAQHYWPGRAPESDNPSSVEGKTEEIVNKARELHETLFKPTYETPIKRLKQPLLVPPDIQLKPYYLAELLTVIEGGKGRDAETKTLLEKDKNNTTEELINNGYQLMNGAVEALSHLTGNSPRSLALIPILYFYTESGRYVRSLLYGLLYFFLLGGEDDILTRKRIFSAHRATFEQIILNNKEDIVSGITRKTGSGPEVTYQTAQYYHGLLELLVKYNDNTQSLAFLEDYAELTKKLTNKASKAKIPQSPEGKSRTFTTNQKSALVINNLFNGITRCGICNGMLDPGSDVQHDHILEVFKGGKTLPDNQRLVHPFCNNQSNREIIEDIKKGRRKLMLPRFTDADLSTEPRQLTLSFFDDPFFG